MQKTCRNELCSRKFEKTSLSDLCPPCNMAFKDGGNQNQRRNENMSRQTKARSDIFDTNRQISEFEFNPISLNTVSHITPTQTLTSTTRPHTMMSTTTSMTGYKFTTSLPSTHSTSAPRDHNTAFNRNEDRIEDIHAKLDHLIKKSDEADQMKITISSNASRLDRIEAKLGKPEDIAVPLSIAIRNLPLPGHGEDDLQIVKALLFEINARDVNPEQDIIKVHRQGATSENLGTVFVEMVSDEVRASVMKTKKVLEQHQNPCLRRIIIKNMKSRQEMKMDIAMNEMLKKLPGGENLYIANNGHIREKTAQQMSFQMSLQNHMPRVPMPRIQASAPPPPQPIYFASERGATSWRHSNPVPGFRHSFTAHPVPEASLQKFHAPGPVYASTNNDDSIFRYSLPPPPPSVPAPAIPYPAPTSGSSMTSLPTSLGPPGSVPLCSSSQVNQATSLPPVPGDHNLSQADLVVASQANLQQHQQEQQQGQQLPEQPQQQELLTSEPVSDL